MQRSTHPTARVARRVSRRRLVLLGASSFALFASAGCKKTAPSSCDDVSGLTPEEVGIRKTLEYQDQTPFAEKTCERCLQYVSPASADQCGGCKVMEGPVHPRGYCKVFAPKT